MRGCRLGRFAGIAVLGGLVSTIGCGEPLCEPALSPEEAYSVHLIDDYTSAGRFTYSIANGDSYPGSVGSCQASDGFEVGASFTLRGHGEQSARNNLCEYVTADFENPPAGLTIVGPSTNALALNRAMGKTGRALRRGRREDEQLCGLDLG
jgi:hypothetical protein